MPRAMSFNLKTTEANHEMDLQDREKNVKAEKDKP